jgi:phosphonate transport system permease protein
MVPRRVAALAVAALLAGSVVLALAEAGLFEEGRASRGLRNMRLFLDDMTPPVTNGDVLEVLLAALWETVQMAWAGTLLGALLALPLAVLAAGPLSRPWLAHPARVLLAAIRTVPSLLWAVFFVVVVGLGSLAGILALAAYTTGYLGKLFYEALEAVDPEVLDATRATGANALQVTRHAAIPEAGNALVSQGLFAFEYNVRASSILGLVGAGGIGFYILNFLNRLDYQSLATALLMVFALLLLVDALSRLVRKRFLHPDRG